MATKLLMVLYTLGPREFTVGYWMSPLLWQGVPTTPHVMGLYRDCSQVPFLLKLQYCSHKRKWVGKKVNGDENDFGPQKEMQHLAQEVLLECPKEKARSRRIKDSPRLGAEYTGGWILPPASDTVAVAAPPSPHSLFLKDWWGEWETSPGSTGFLCSASASVSPVISWKVLAFLLSFITRGGSRWYVTGGWCRGHP